MLFDADRASDINIKSVLRISQPVVGCGGALPAGVPPARKDPRNLPVDTASIVMMPSPAECETLRM